MPQRLLTIFWSRFGDGLGRGRVRDTDHRHRRLLRARRERPQKMVIPRRCDHRATVPMRVPGRDSTLCQSASHFKAVSKSAHAWATPRSGEVMPGNFAQPPFSM